MINALNQIDLAKFSDIDSMWNEWYTAFISVCNQHVPIQTHRVKDKLSPWITRDLLDSMYERDRIHKQASLLKSDELMRVYRHLRNKVNNMVRDAKRAYFHKQVTGANNSKDMWKVLRSAMNRKKANNDLSSDKADPINEYFINVGINNSLNSEPSTHPNLKPSRPCVSSKFIFDVIRLEHVEKQLKCMSDQPNYDILSIDGKILKLLYDIIAPSFTFLFNYSLQNGSFPTEFKKARVIPIYKGKGSKEDFGNFRPISIVSHVSKIFEKIVNFQFISYLQENGILSIHQSGFVNNHSTNTALLKVTNDLLTNLNEGKFTAVCSLDIRKCFDTIKYDVLFNKLHNYGVNGKELEWCSRFLYGRKQAIQCHNNII